MRGYRPPCSMQSEFESNLDPQSELHRYQALLDLAGLMVRHYSFSELFHHIALRLQRVADFQLLHFGLYDPKENVLRRHLWEGEGPVVPESVPLADSATGFVWETQTALLIRDLQEDRRFPQVFEPLRDLGVGSRKVDAYGEQGVCATGAIARLVTLIADNCKLHLYLSP